MLKLNVLLVYVSIYIYIETPSHVVKISNVPEFVFIFVFVSSGHVCRGSGFYFARAFKVRNSDYWLLLSCIWIFQLLIFQWSCRISWTKSLWRLYFLIKRCYDLREPVLLVGETGGGKTTVCQLLAEALGLRLHILNCHQYTETSEFLGVGYFYLPLLCSGLS